MNATERLPPNPIAAIWGFAEATLFFVVPDVWLTLVARERLVPGLLAALAALGGALLGGLLMMQLAVTGQGRLVSIVEFVPAISQAQVEKVREQLHDRGARAMLLGPISGTPYKLYAALAPEAGIPIATFVLWSIAARLPRFVAVTVLAHLALRLCAALGIIRNKTRALLGFWLGFYILFLTLMPW